VDFNNTVLCKYHSPCKTVGVVVLLFEDSNWFVHLAKNRFTNNVLGVNNGVLLCILYIWFFVLSAGQPFLWYFYFPKKKKKKKKNKKRFDGGIRNHAILGNELREQF
jgi:hypothetical protein